MERAGDLLGRVARKLGHPHAALAWLSSSWPQIVGKTLAAHTRPLRCAGGVLEIAADAKPWQKQLDEMTGDFCARINQAWGRALIREVKFVVPKRGTSATSAAGSPRNSGPGPQRLSYELDNDHTPFIRRRKL
jgi:predicted nucleic acid-binding Zn ribbon protein